MREFIQTADLSESGFQSLDEMESSVHHDESSFSGTSFQITSSIVLKKAELVDFYKSIFDNCDTNNDGVISISELKEFIETQENMKISKEIVEKICLHFDTNKDEQLDFQEFLEMINSPLFISSFQNLATRILKFIAVLPNKKEVKLRRSSTQTGIYEKKFKWRKSNIRMLLLSAIQIIMFYVNKAYKTDMKHGPYYCTMSFHPCRKYEMYRYFSYSFVHSDEPHLFGNVFLQLLLGIPMEFIHTWRVIPAYFFGVLGASMTHSVVHRSSPLTGASGGVAAFITIPIAAVILNWREMSHPTFHLLLFGIITALDIVHKVLFDNSEDISYAAHVGGAVVGLLFGVNILKNLKRTRIEIIIWHICWVSLVLFGLVLVILDASLPNNCDYVTRNCTYLYNY